MIVGANISYVFFMICLTAVYPIICLFFISLKAFLYGIENILP